MFNINLQPLNQKENLQDSLVCHISSFFLIEGKNSQKSEKRE